MASPVSSPIQFLARFELQPTCREGSNRKIKMVLEASRFKNYFEDWFYLHTPELTDFLYEFPKPLILSGTIQNLETFEEQSESLFQLMKKLTQSRRDVKKLTDLSPDTYADTVEEGYSLKENHREYLRCARKACRSFNANLATIRAFLKEMSGLRASFETEDAARLVERVERISATLPEPRKRKLDRDC